MVPKAMISTVAPASKYLFSVIRLRRAQAGSFDHSISPRE
jgi:hypothetical protein